MQASSSFSFSTLVRNCGLSEGLVEFLAASRGELFEFGPGLVQLFEVLLDLHHVEVRGIRRPGACDALTGR